MEYPVVINGIRFTAFYREQTVEEIFLPLLRKLTEMQKEKGKRILVMLAAPPGAGKSTLLSFLEHLSKEREELGNLPVGNGLRSRPADWDLATLQGPGQSRLSPQMQPFHDQTRWTFSSLSFLGMLLGGEIVNPFLVLIVSLEAIHGVHTDTTSEPP